MYIWERFIFKEEKMDKISPYPPFKPFFYCFIFISSYVGEDFVDYFDGTLGSPCFNPCLSTKVLQSLAKINQYLIFFKIRGSMVSNERTDSALSTFDVTLDQVVTVTESRYPKMSFAKFFSDLGGSLGLWLGIGFIQIGVLLVNLVSKLRKSFLMR